MLNNLVAARSKAAAQKLQITLSLAELLFDDDDTVHLSHDNDNDSYIAPIVFRMDYKGADGKCSERTVRLLKLTPLTDGDYKVSAWCFSRSAYRGFLLSRILTIYDVATGQVFDDAREFFVDCDILHTESPEAQSIRQCQNELIVLSFVGACDGFFSPSEFDEVVKHVFDRCDTPLDEAKVRKMVGPLSPDEKAFERALRNLRDSPQNIKRGLWRTMRRVIDADHRVDAAEAVIAEHIAEALSINF